jgi:hypothetical protein
MPLSEPTQREFVHQRHIDLRGYHRVDGCIDVEAHLTDTKTYGFSTTEREVGAGEPVHEMWMRMTVNRARVIVACEAATEHGPFSICPQAAPNFSALAGLSLQRGFLKAATERVAGAHGCTHLRELLQQMATVALHTLQSRGRDLQPADATASVTSPKLLVNSCLAFAENGPVVKRLWPDLAKD